MGINLSLARLLLITVLSLWDAEGGGQMFLCILFRDSDQDTVSCRSSEREVFSFNTDGLAPQEL